MNAIHQQRQAILAELARLGPMRRGSITDQYVETTGADGKPRRRGPYPVYTVKKEGHTVSRRLNRPELVTACQAHIAQGRRFQELVDQLMRLGEVLSDQALSDTALKKTPKPKSKPALRPKGSSPP
ncbi:MAG: DUF6788 family protein [Kiritimatiellia bacterium]|jgi:hypothetical protein|nr:MAG: hypothetical protein BWX44_01612 [Spirochaetes bacterium ADurb.Bin001]